MQVQSTVETERVAQSIPERVRRIRECFSPEVLLGEEAMPGSVQASWDNWTQWDQWNQFHNVV